MPLRLSVATNPYRLQIAPPQVAEQTANKSNASQTTASTQRDWKEIDQNLDALAKVTAAMMQDQDFRITLHQEILKQKTGDYEALYSELRKQKINGVPFTKYFIETAKEIGAVSKNQKLGKLLSNIPYLHFAVYNSLSEWEPNNDVLPVIFAPNAVDDTELEQITGYNSDQNEIILDAQNAPEFPVLVLGVNERVLNSPNKSGDVSADYVTDPCEINPDCGGGGAPEPGPIYLDLREEGSKDILNYLNVDNLGNYEPWIRGKADMRFQVDYAVGPAKREKYWQVKRDKIQSGYYPEKSVGTWYAEDYGNYAVYYWWEVDTGNTYTFSISLPIEGVTIGFDFSAKDGDDPFGMALVNFKDPAELEYDLGDLRFNLKYEKMD